MNSFGCASNITCNLREILFMFLSAPQRVFFLLLCFFTTSRVRIFQRRYEQ